MVKLLGRSLLVLALLGPGAALAQEPEGQDDDAAPTTEEPDPTRLDVERLPPEAIPISRELYAHGFFIEAYLGGLGFVGGPGDLIDGGPFASIGVGLEIVPDWLMVVVAAEGSMHNSSAPTPPARTSFEILGGSASLRVQFPFTEAFAIWLAGQFSVQIPTTDLLEQFGFLDSTTLGIAYGGQLGVDWHLRSRHHSIGVLGGVRHYPMFEGVVGGAALGVHGTAYIRYVF